MEEIKIIECPRDAMQGISEFISSENKALYINQLLKVGFDTIDFGSFVSPKAIPQMRDTAEVLSKLDLNATNSKLLAIVANQRGADDAAHFDEIQYLGFPLSLSETFQQRNTNKSIEEALQVVESINNLCNQKNKELVCYLSMGFGNPYGEDWSTDTVEKFVNDLDALGIKTIALSDTIGTADVENITYIFEYLIPQFPHIEFGAHLHTVPEAAERKIKATIDAGCKRIDAAIKGYGGCPMAKDDLTGNMDTISLVSYLKKHELLANSFEENAFASAIEISSKIFPN